MKKRIKWIAVASAAFLYSCSENTSLQDAEEGSIVTTTISVKTPEAIGTRAVPNNVYGDGTTWAGESGYPSIGNIDLNEHPLTYTVGIYVGKEVAGEGGSTTTTWTLVDKQAQKGVANDEAYFNFRLIKGRNYKIVGYADFNNEEKADLEDISFATGLNDELDDAFFVSENFVAQEHVSAILKRPFGKLRLIAGDFNTFAAGEKYTITDVKVEYKGQPMLATDKFNALTGDFNYDKDAEGDHTKNAKAASYALEYGNDDKAEHAAVFTQYLPANFGEADVTGTYTPVDETLPVPQSWMYPFDVTVTYKDEKNNEFTLNRQFQFDIPVKRNWLTTVDATNFWTDNSNIKVSIDHRFDGFIKTSEVTEYVKNEDELYAAIDKITKSESKKGRIVLGANIDITKTMNANVEGGHAGMVLLASTGTDITLDLNKYTIENKNKDIWYLICIRGDWGNPHLSIEGPGTINAGDLDDGDNDNPIAITLFFGGELTINSGNIICSGNAHAVYSHARADYPDLGPSKVTINGGYFENTDGDIYIDRDAPTANCVLINQWNGSNGIQPAYGPIAIKGGTFVGYDPRWGDNVTHNDNGAWVPDGYTVLEETVNGKKTYTVISPENPDYYSPDKQGN